MYCDPDYGVERTKSGKCLSARSCCGATIVRGLNVLEGTRLWSGYAGWLAGQGSKAPRLPGTRSETSVLVLLPYDDLQEAPPRALIVYQEFYSTKKHFN